MLNTNTKEGLLIGAGSLLAVKLCIILYLGYDDKKEKSRQILSVKNVGKARVTDNINIFKIYRKFVFVFVFGIIVSVEAVCYFDGEIKTIFIGCEVGSKMSPEVLTYTLKNNDVIEKTEGTFNYGRDKREKYVELKKLDDCVVLDKNNWQCGGKSPDWDKDWIREQFTVFDGLFNYHPAKFKEDKRRSACGETFDQIKWYLKWYYW